MTTSISARAALARDLESAQAGLKGAQEAYEKAEHDFTAAQVAVTRAYDARAMNARNVGRIQKAIAILDGEEDQ